MRDGSVRTDTTGRQSVQFDCGCDARVCVLDLSSRDGRSVKGIMPFGVSLQSVS